MTEDEHYDLPESSFFLIWSNEHAAWWRAEELGYTKVIEHAGIYSYADMQRIVNKPVADPDQKHAKEIAVLALLYGPGERMLVLDKVSDPRHLVEGLKCEEEATRG